MSCKDGGGGGVRTSASNRGDESLGSGTSFTSGTQSREVVVISIIKKLWEKRIYKIKK